MSKILPYEEEEWDDIEETPHSDHKGKNYYTKFYGLIHIKNDYLVQLIDSLIYRNMNEFKYVKEVNEFKNIGGDIFNELENAWRILGEKLS